MCFVLFVAFAKTCIFRPVHKFQWALFFFLHYGPIRKYQPSPQWNQTFLIPRPGILARTMPCPGQSDFPAPSPQGCVLFCFVLFYRGWVASFFGDSFTKTSTCVPKLRWQTKMGSWGFGKSNISGLGGLRGLSLIGPGCFYTSPMPLET